MPAHPSAWPTSIRSRRTPRRLLSSRKQHRTSDRRHGSVPRALSPVAMPMAHSCTSHVLPAFGVAETMSVPPSGSLRRIARARDMCVQRLLSTGSNRTTRPVRAQCRNPARSCRTPQDVVGVRARGVRHDDGAGPAGCPDRFAQRHSGPFAGAMPIMIGDDPDRAHPLGQQQLRRESRRRSPTPAFGTVARRLERALDTLAGAAVRSPARSARRGRRRC